MSVSENPSTALIAHVLYSYDEDGDEYAEPCYCAKTYDHDEEGYRYEHDDVCPVNGCPSRSTRGAFDV